MVHSISPYAVTKKTDELMSHAYAMTERRPIEEGVRRFAQCYLEHHGT